MMYYQRIRDLREDNDKSQKDIAVLLKTTQPQYARYETGEIKITKTFPFCRWECFCLQYFVKIYS
jgi:transcriptional regulator with XRE-family HTH domain